MKCSVCGAAHDPGDRFCRCCGRRFNNQTEVSALAATAAAEDFWQTRRLSRRLRALAIITLAVASLLLVLAQAAPDLIKLTGFKPKDLGVTWTQEDYDRAFARVAVSVDAQPEGQDRSKYTEEFLGSQQADWTFTDSELTALINGGSHAGYWPFANVQVKFSEGNEVEISGTVSAAKLLSYPAVAQCLPQEIVSYINSIPMDLPIAAKAHVEASGSKALGITLEELEASGISMEAYLADDQANMIVESIVNAMLRDASPVEINGITTGDGTLHFTGQWYTELRRSPKAAD